MRFRAVMIMCVAPGLLASGCGGSNASKSTPHSPTSTPPSSAPVPAVHSSGPNAGPSDACLFTLTSLSRTIRGSWENTPTQLRGQNGGTVPACTYKDSTESEGFLVTEVVLPPQDAWVPLRPQIANIKRTKCATPATDVDHGRGMVCTDNKGSIMGAVLTYGKIWILVFSPGSGNGPSGLPIKAQALKLLGMTPT